MGSYSLAGVACTGVGNACMPGTLWSHICLPGMCAYPSTKHLANILVHSSPGTQGWLVAWRLCARIAGSFCSTACASPVHTPQGRGGSSYWSSSPSPPASLGRKITLPRNKNACVWGGQECSATEAGAVVCANVMASTVKTLISTSKQTCTRSRCTVCLPSSLAFLSA